MCYHKEKIIFTREQVILYRNPFRVHCYINKSKEIKYLKQAFQTYIKNNKNFDIEKLAPQNTSEPLAGHGFRNTGQGQDKMMDDGDAIYKIDMCTIDGIRFS